MSINRENENSPQSPPRDAERRGESDYATDAIFRIIKKELGGACDDNCLLKVKESMVNVGLWPSSILTGSKIFCDSIHGNMTIHPACVAVIDTPEFQRLRDIKQLGMAHYVYPGAAHTRFEHSLGVCYLAGQFVRQLKENQPELKINNKDILCLELAALCHDLGHGPYSHLFDRNVVPLLGIDDWKHESASQGILDLIYQQQNVKDAFDKYKLDEKDIHFIKMLIVGNRSSTEAECLKTGRDKNKAFLYEIVANQRNGIDVDKWDYIARDCHQLGIRNSFDHSRFMKFARVISVKNKDGKKEMNICVRDKELINLYNLFTSRYLLHKNAYQHKVMCSLDIMVGEALRKADKDVHFEGYKMSEIVNEWKTYTKSQSSMNTVSEDIQLKLKAYLLLTDNILFKIRDAPGDSIDLNAAKAIVGKILERKFLKLVRETEPFQPKEGPKESKRTKEARIKEDIKALSTGIGDDDFFVQVVNLDFGLKKENPLDNIGVYSKKNIDVVIDKRNEMSHILKPYIFEEQMIRVYANDESKIKLAAIQNAWKMWQVEKFPGEKKKPETKESTTAAEAMVKPGPSAQ